MHFTPRSPSEFALLHDSEFDYNHRRGPSNYQDHKNAVTKKRATQEAAAAGESSLTEPLHHSHLF
jgi:hypothetical protein